MNITVTTNNQFSKTFEYLGNLQSFKKNKLRSILKRYGEQGVMSLKQSTPKDSGETASLWRYEIIEEGSNITLAFINDAQNDGIPIAVLIQYGHGTGTGGYVQPNDYINPAMQPIFDRIAKDAWKEVCAL
ncbi:MAG: HK97 gp10 family phage protein [Clostridiales bacterium]|nr:HK97 gp10 family phage protein [Clostridiales bacterium]